MCMNIVPVYARLTQDGNKAKSQLTKANQTKTKMENLARELQKVTHLFHICSIRVPFS